MFSRCSRRGQIIALFSTLLFCILLTNGSAHANQSFNVNMTVFGVWLPQTQERLDVAVWFPARRQLKRTTLEDWTPFTPINHNRISDAIIPGFYPLVFISHDTSGSKFAHHDLAESIASKGFIVIAPDHAGDSFYDNSKAFSAEILRKRPLQIIRSLEIVLSSPGLSPYADETRIGLIGVGFGSITAMQLLGADLQKKSWSTSWFSASEQNTHSVFFETKLDRIPHDMETLSKTYGRSTYTPCLDIFAPQLIDLDAIHQKQDNTAKAKFHTSTPQASAVINNFYKQHLEISRVSGTRRKPPLAVAAMNELSPYPFVDTQVTLFAPADWLGYTRQQPSINESHSTPNKKKSVEEQVHRRPATQRKILSIALLSPAGGILFNHLPEGSLQTSAAIFHPDQNEIYPAETHLLPYLSLFAIPPRLLSFPKGDHYSVFSPCTGKSERQLIGFCGNLPPAQQKELATARDSFLLTFLKDSLGTPLPVPEPSGYVAAPNTPEPPVKVLSKQAHQKSDPPVQERKRTRRTR